MALPKVGETISADELKRLQSQPNLVLPKVGETISADEFNKLKSTQSSTSKPSPLITGTSSPKKQSKGLLQGFQDLNPFGGAVLGEALGTQLAKFSPEAKEIRRKEASGQVPTGTFDEAFKGPSGKRIAGDVGNIASNFFPIGKLATGGKALLKPLIGGASKPVANVGTGATFGSTALASRQASEGEEINPTLGGIVGGAIPIAGPLARGIGNVRRTATGFTSGAGGAAIREFEESLLAGGARKKATLEAFEGKVDPREIVGEANNALNMLKDAKRTNFQKQLAKVEGSTKKLSDAGIKAELDKQLKQFKITRTKDGLDFSKGAIFSKTAQEDIREIVDRVSRLGKEDGDELTVIGVDRLKRFINDAFSESSQARAFIQSVSKSTRKELSKVKGYDKLQEDFRNATRDIDEITKVLSVAQSGGNVKNVDAAFKKLISVFRSNQDFRQQLLRELDEATGSNLIPRVAGAQLSQVIPNALASKLQGGLVGVSGISGGVGILPVVAGLALFSPKLVGQLSRVLNVPKSALDKVFKSIEEFSGADIQKGIITPGDAIIDRLQEGLLK